ncbi:MAG: hypothetical protein WAV73_06015 [Candidatus Moraniibacteriota bacterium]
MNTKKTLILVFALVVLFGGIFIIAKSIRDKNVVNNPVDQNAIVKSNMFGQDAAKDNKNARVDVSGSVEAIAEKTLTIKTPQELTVVNINGTTPVIITLGADQPIAGQMADLKKGDSVKVTYDKTTKNASMISITRAQAVEKKK